MLGTTFLVVAVSLVGQGPATLNAKVLEFAQANIGEMVGNGQCTALAVEALRYAGARRRGPGSQWGEPRATLDDAQPGDILQFQDAVFQGRRRLRNGALYTWRLEARRHTAIVADVRKRGPIVRLTILHQNVEFDGADPDQKHLVQEWAFNKSDLRSGEVRAYRPVVE